MKRHINENLNQILCWTLFHCSTGIMSSWCGTLRSVMVSLGFLSPWRSFGLLTSSCMSCKFHWAVSQKADLFYYFLVLHPDSSTYKPPTVWMMMSPKRVRTSTSTTRVTSAGTGCCDSSRPATWRSSVFPLTCRTAHSRLAPTCTPVRKGSLTNTQSHKQVMES